LVQRRRHCAYLPASADYAKPASRRVAVGHLAVMRYGFVVNKYTVSAHIWQVNSTYDMSVFNIIILKAGEYSQIGLPNEVKNLKKK